MKPSAKRKASVRASARSVHSKRASTKRSAVKRAATKRPQPPKRTVVERMSAKRVRSRRASVSIPIIPVSEIAVTTHRFRIGESVHLTAGIYIRAGATSVYKVTQLLPSDGDEQQYRIKSESEPHERVAKQSQLEPIA